MTSSRLLPVLALTGLLAGGLSATARADDTTPAQAADLQAQLRSWFASLAGPAAEYNGKFMVNQMVLRGSSSFTVDGHSRPSYRNFFPAQARWQMTGLRLAKDL